MVRIIKGLPLLAEVKWIDAGNEMGKLTHSAGSEWWVRRGPNFESGEIWVDFNGQLYLVNGSSQEKIPDGLDMCPKIH